MPDYIKVTEVKHRLLNEKTYSVSEVAEILSLSPKTVRKWLSPREPDKAFIAPEDWLRLPNGQIRIRERAVRMLLYGLE